MAEIAIGIATEFGVKAVEKLFQKVYSTVKDKIILVSSLDDNIGFLKETLPGVKELMLNAHAVMTVDSQSSRCVNLPFISKEFVKGLRKFVYDGEDIVDDFDIKVCRGRMGKKQKLAIAGKLKRLYAKFQGLLQREQDAEDSVKSLKENLRAPGRESHPSLLRKPSTSVMKRDGFKMVGRDAEKTSLVRDLLGNKSRPSVVLLTGMGGIGKTTLAHTVLKDPQIVSHFAFAKWVTVGDRNLDPKNVLEQLVDGEATDSLHKAKEKVQEMLEGRKRFLIVLDDVWDAEEDLKRQWNELWEPLSYGGEGSRVIVTTREEQVKCSMQALPVEVRRLGYLSNEECLQIFESFAFPDGFDIPSSSTSSPNLSLREIGKRIVDEKVKGVPLAARVIGSSLRGKGVTYWEAAATEIKQRNMNSAILWSYLNLPVHLKQCFAFCSLFPKDTRLDSTYIILLWMAHGFVVESDAYPTMTLVDIGGIYFDDLVDASLIEFDGAEDQPINDFSRKMKVKYYYKMHDLVHDFASNILGDEFSEQGKEQRQTLRHLIATQSYSLRAFMLRGPHHLFDSRMGQLTTARSLCIPDRNYSIDRSQMLLSQLFKKLLHVRYLDISGIRFSKLPESICCLYALQTLILCKKKHNVQTIGFPNTMSKHLLNLHHIEAGHNVSRIGGLGRLTKLHSIGGRFILDEDNWQSIEELRNLKQLRGALEIEGLDHVRCSELVSKEQLLQNHENLIVLVYDMYRRSEEPQSARVSGALQNIRLRVHAMFRKPREIFGNLMQCLQNLEDPEPSDEAVSFTEDLEPCYGAVSFTEDLEPRVLIMPAAAAFTEDVEPREVMAAAYMDDLESARIQAAAVIIVPKNTPDQLPPSEVLNYLQPPRNVEDLEIKHYKMDHLPSWLENTGFNLLSLRLHDCRVKKLPQKLPSSLEQLHINFCDLQDLPEELPFSLKHLEIRSCNNLQALPHELPSSLKHLEIRSCNNLQTLPQKLPSSLEYLEIRSCNNLQALPHELSSSLKHLEILGCNNLQTLPQKLPSSLEYLEILSCVNLQALPEEFPSTLERLIISKCNNLQTLPKQLPSSLERLNIRMCNNLQALPEQLPSSLKRLNISKCNNLKALPEQLPFSLEYLRIRGCNNLQALPEQLPSSLEVSVEDCQLLHRPQEQY